LPSALRWSFLTASRMENHVKKGTRKSIPTIGTLSGFITICAKFGSGIDIPMSSNAKRDASQPADATERAQIQAKVRAQLHAANLLTGKTPNGALKPAESNLSEIQALQQQVTFVNSSRTQGALTNGALLAAKSPNQVRVQPPQSSNPLAHAPAPTKFCPAPQIHAVNGKSSGVVFTQDPTYNDYIISGCGFGAQEGQVYLSGAISNGRIDLVLKPGHWNDTQIEATFKPGLTGVLDGWPDLIVAPLPAGSPTAKFPNSRFYAQRQSVLLPNIPQQYATLANVPVGDGSQGTGTLYCERATGWRTGLTLFR
jgi:hypothetical protein